MIVTIKIYKLYSARVKRGLGFEPTTLRDLVGCSKTELLGTLWWARVQYWLEAHRAATQPRAGSYELSLCFSFSRYALMWQRDAVSEFICHALLWQRDAVSEFIWTSTWLCSRAMRFQSIPTIWPLLTNGVHTSSVVEHPTRSRRVVGSNPIWHSEVFRVSVSPRIYIIPFIGKFTNRVSS